MDKYMLALLTFLLPAMPSRADFSCVASVSYQWKKDGGEPQAMFFVNMAGNAMTEEEAKAQVLELANREKARARDACTRRHENLSGCISAKFAAEASLLAKLGFGARKSLEEAVSADCKLQQGQCLDPVVSDIKCLQVGKTEGEGDGKTAEKGKEEQSPAKKDK
jgi:hypothetical protein